MGRRKGSHSARKRDGTFVQNSKSMKTKTYFDDDNNDDESDIEIDIRDEEEEEGVDNEEVEAFIKKLGLDEIPEDVKLNQKKKQKNKKKKDNEPVAKKAEFKERAESQKSQEMSSVEDHKDKKKKKKRSKEKNNVNIIKEERTPIQHNEVSSSGMRSPIRVPMYQPLDDVVVKYIDGKWYDKKFEADSKTFDEPSEEVTNKMRIDAQKLYEKELELYEKKYRGEDQDQTQWMKTVVSTGVLADKVAALALRIQEAPVHSLSSVEQLMAMTKKKGKREALLAMDALRRLFLEELLPGDRKLRLFEQNPFHLIANIAGRDTKKYSLRLILWYYEAQLKSKFQDFVLILQTLSTDNVTAVKSKAIMTMYELLVNKPEQEKKLLSMLVNKIGDPETKLASSAVHWLQKLVEIHPSMKSIVVREVEGLLYRPNINIKAQYYCICFLNQLILSADEAELATKLIIIYFTFFNIYMKKKQHNQKMLSAVLTGVNRAYHYSKIEDEKVNEQMDLIFKVVHQAAFGPALQALMLLRQVLASRHTMTDRYYSALYKKLMDPSLRSSPQQAMFLNLLFKTLKADTNNKRVQAFIKRILQVCNTHAPPFICGALFMISEVTQKKPQLKTFQQWNEDSDDDEEHFTDIKGESDTEIDPQEKDTEHSKKKPSSWVHKKTHQGDAKTHYDPLVRNPTYSGAENSALWELKKLSGHFHPSVSLFASQLLSGETVVYAGNPLQDFTLIRFLDRYVYRNPKKQTEASESKQNVLASKSSKSSSDRVVINSKNYLTFSTDNIPLDAQMFYKYFSQKEEIARKKKLQTLDNNTKKKKKKVEDEGSSEDEDMPGRTEEEWEIDSEASSVGDEEFEDMMEEEMGLSDDVDLDDEDDDYIREVGDDEESDVDDHHLDFAGEFGRKVSKKERKEREKGSDSEDDLEDGEDADEEFEAQNDEFDEEGFGASDDDDNEYETPKPTGSTKRKIKDAGGKQQKKKTKKMQKEDPELLENADEFTAMIDEAASAKFDNMSMHALANKDKANLKQLKWEENRDKWMRGRDPKSIIKKKKQQRDRHQWKQRNKQGNKKKFKGKKKK